MPPPPPHLSLYCSVSRAFKATVKTHVQDPVITDICWATIYSFIYLVIDNSAIYFPFIRAGLHANISYLHDLPVQR